MFNINDYVNILPCFKLDTRSDIIRISILSRFFVIILQFISNTLIIDHNADVFISPKNNVTLTVLDEAVEYFLNGFIRWDAQYFLHITKYGYTYENVLAFFPLYPILIRILSNVFTAILPLVNEDSLIIITFLVFNLFIFVSTSLVLYDLTTEVLGKNLAYKSTILFCFNPASIFFSAPYTECLFSYLTFKSIWHLHHSKQSNKNIVISVFYISLSICTRSNGMLNVGFLIYYYIKSIFATKKVVILQLVKHGILLTYFILLCFVPFGLIQSYNYFMFCKDFTLDLPEFILHYAKENEYVLPGSYSIYKQKWCSNTIPLSYSYVQKHYWNVGFLNYYEFKQIPNFLLALPIIYIIVSNCIQFFKEHKSYCLNLGIFNIFKEEKKNVGKYDKKLFVFCVHSFVLTIFCLFFIHVQVTTRMLCSASPLLYWFCAYYYENHNSKLKIFLLDTNVTMSQKLINYYFLGYYLIGTIMFCNFLPWT